MDQELNFQALINILIDFNQNKNAVHNYADEKLIIDDIYSCSSKYTYLKDLKVKNKKIELELSFGINLKKLIDSFDIQKGLYNYRDNITRFYLRSTKKIKFNLINKMYSDMDNRVGIKSNKLSLYSPNGTEKVVLINNVLIDYIIIEFEQL